MRIRKVPRVDWFRVLHELQVNGMPIQSAARHIGLSHSTVLGWRTGSEPRYGDGELLIALWVKVTGKGRDHLPRVAPMLLRDTDAATEDEFIAEQGPAIQAAISREPVLTNDGWVIPKAA